VTPPVSLARPWPPQPWDIIDGGPTAEPENPFVEKFTGMRLIDWIWHVRGSVPLAPGQSTEEAFERLDPLFHEVNTKHERTGDTLTFTKKDQRAQDKMSVFDGGTLRVERSAGGAVLRYHLTSRALLFCFLAPLLFLSFAGLTILIVKHQTAVEAANKAAKPPEKPKVEVPMNPIDKFLGAPAPEKPKKGEEEKGGRRGKKPTPTPAYVFAGMFAFLWLVGRVLEDRLVKRLFKRKLAGV